MLLLLQVVGLVLVLCAMLEQSHSISLTAIMAAELYPSVDGESGMSRPWQEAPVGSSAEVTSV